MHEKIDHEVDEGKSLEMDNLIMIQRHEDGASDEVQWGDDQNNTTTVSEHNLSPIQEEQVVDGVVGVKYAQDDNEGGWKTI